MQSPRIKISSPSIDKFLPELRLRTSSSQKPSFFTHSRSSKLFSDPQPSKLNLNLQSRHVSPRESQCLLMPETMDSKLSEEFRKFNSVFIDNSINGTLFKDFTFEEAHKGPPANRKDAKLLIEWLDFMLSQLTQEKFENSEKLFEVTNEIYTACFQEVIKQVSAHCKERGLLMFRVWKAYRSMFEKALAISKAKLEAMKEKLSCEKLKFQESCNEKLEIAEEKLMLAMIDIEDLKAKIKEQGETIEHKTAKENKLLYSMSILQAQYKIVKKELLMAKEDTRILRVRYENISAEDEYNNVIKRLVIPKRFKRKTSLELEKELEKDPLMSDFISDESDIFDKISRFEKSLDQLFCRDDFTDKSTETRQVILLNTESQTELGHTCGDSIGVKSRKAKLLHTYSIRAKKPMFFPDFRPYNQRTITLEASNLSINPLSPELKKKHLRIRRLLSTIREVKNK